MTNGGPLSGVRVVELAGIGPGPYAAMLLADLGAEVVRVERPGPAASEVPPELDVLRRNRRSIVVDLRHPDGRQTVLAMAAKADVLLEGFRPGVTERLGLGPEDCLAVNPRIVYGRMTGWGQTGPLAPSAGHDINYIALTGALGAIGRAGGAPVPPVNLVGDFGGGSTFLVIGVLAALFEATRSGQGQVVDAAIVDGASSLTALLHGLLAAGRWIDRRGENFLDTGVPWYENYQTSDGGWMSVGALEPKFYAEFTALLGLDPETAALRNTPSAWPRLRTAITEAFAGRTRQQWADVFEGTDACVAPVLSLTEAAEHPHLAARETFIDVGGVRQPAPAPRFSRSAPATPTAPPAVGADGRDILSDWGIPGASELIAAGVVVCD
ncbi:CaiB/BaiF CoA-transferase family protein [Mycobacterium sp. CVI_P3]|uniref:CaiB/BaiF CoA-transferase family protein n=1 Tax=Mycobacterium pinniadriaticum TaxID=2994102 RepID=A0ABT3SAQ5_9MYCO|nr:CaiB/BaiF CoA-transferase family protein [Mycobacterium pinniadriaticum]MCX2930117.1 CaiB/BaiF CoA-transferase family protein [Mycobacterium pinniadriaticum]MCX2936234.1 CaiB/BaiF CoA-transferase family protein [Mycobacterium pinniadriaticum]